MGKNQIKIISITLYIISGLVFLSTLGDTVGFFGHFDFDWYMEHSIIKLVIVVICIGAGVFISKY